VSGNPSVVPFNLQGVGGAVVVFQLRTSAARDGTVIGALQPGVITAPLYGDRKGYETRDLTYLGSANSEVDVCWVRSDATVTTYADVFSKEVIIGGSSPGDTSYDLPTAQNNLIGTKFKLVPGYKGVPEMLLAIERNEVQGLCGTGMPAMMAQKAAWVNSGFLKPLVQENSEGNPKLDQIGVPRAPTFARTKEDREALDLVYVPQKFGRPFAMPPGNHPERSAVLRRAFMEALRNPDLLAEAAKMNLDIVAMSGEDMEKLIVSIFETPPGVVARAKTALTAQPAKP
jgi:tripartite-type tricarboxylate transporter receptor subunit TctC